MQGGEKRPGQRDGSGFPGKIITTCPCGCPCSPAKTRYSRFANAPACVWLHWVKRLPVIASAMILFASLPPKISYPKREKKAETAILQNVCFSVGAYILNAKIRRATSRTFGLSGLVARRGKSSHEKIKRWPLCFFSLCARRYTRKLPFFRRYRRDKHKPENGGGKIEYTRALKLTLVRLRTLGPLCQTYTVAEIRLVFVWFSFYCSLVR